MSLSPHFEVKATLYYRVHDSVMYGGLGTVGFAKQSFGLPPDTQLENLDDTMAMSCRSSLAAMLNVPPEKLDFMTAEEYERESEDDEEDEEYESDL